MTETTIDAQAKQRVRDALLEHVRANLTAAEQSVAAHEDAAQVEQDGATSVDDLSQADAAGDLTALMEESVASQEQDLEEITELNFAPAETVAAGALVGFGGARYVVGVVSSPFEADGHTYEGISTDSPVYAAIEGKSVGDTFEVAGKTQTIEFLA